MKELKREKGTLFEQLRDAKRKSRYHDDHIRIIDAWFKQLIDEVKLLSADTMEEESDFSSIPSALLRADSGTFEEHLQDRSKDIRDVMSRLFNQSMAKTPDIVQMQNRLAQLLALEKQHLLELETSRAEKQELQDRLESASLRYMVAEKKLDRAKSTTVAKLEKGQLLQGMKTEDPDGGPVKREETQTNGFSDNSDALIELEESLNKITNVSDKQKEQLERLEAENSRLTSQLTELSIKATQFSDDDYASTDLFKRMKSQNDDVIKRINDLAARNVQLQQEAQKLQAERTSFRSQLESETRAAITQKDTLLSTADDTVSRLRSNRDELLSDVQQLKGRMDDERISLVKAQELSEAKDDRIRALELENERLSGTEQSRTTLDFPGLSTEELQSKHQELERKYNMLNSELASMSTAFQKASKAANQRIADFAALEEKALRLSAEKSKADQKYFAAMRDKDLRTAEVTILRLQNTKASDLMQQLKDADQSSRSLMTVLEKTLAETKHALTIKTTAHGTAQQQVTEDSIVIEGLKRQTEELKKTLGVKDSTLASTANDCRQAELEIAELKASLKDTKKSLDNWKAKGAGHNTDEHEQLRHMCLCAVCKTNFKNTVIKTCGHLLCDKCVGERLSSRSRKCPHCGKAFGTNDHMRITLG